MIELTDSWAKPTNANDPNFKPGVQIPWGERLSLSPGGHLVRVRFFADPDKPPVVSNHRVIYVQPVLSAEVLSQRNKLLAEADAKIRKGIVELAKQFPNLKKGKDWDRLSRPSASGRIGIHFRRSYGGKAGTDGRWRIAVRRSLSLWLRGA